MRAPRLDDPCERPRGNSPRAHVRAVLLLVSATAALVDCGGIPIAIPTPALTEKNREAYAHTNLLKARALRDEGRLESAARATQRGLRFEPDHAALHRLRAVILEELGQPRRARIHRVRADELAPPRPSLPDEPHPLALRKNAANLLITLLPPAPEILAAKGSTGRVPADWPHGVAAATLARRLALRLPDANVQVMPAGEHAVDLSVGSARAWLAAERPDAVVSVRVDRAYCGRSAKDGHFAVAWLRIATGIPGTPAQGAPQLVRVSLDDPKPGDCETEALARGLEKMLALRALEEALGADPAEPAASFSSRSVRVLFPLLGTRLAAELNRGRRFLAIGELSQALAHFERAAAIDGDDPAAAAFVEEATRSLALVRLLSTSPAPPTPFTPFTSPTPPEGSSLPILTADLSPSQRSGLEAQLAYEQQRRGEMLSALAVLYEVRNAPTPGTIATMRRADVLDPTAVGVGLATDRVPSGTTVEIRTLFAPDGTVLARYYFPVGSQAPVLREDDLDGDGVADRWIAYEGGILREVWERNTPGRAPTVHRIYAPGGDPIERIELDPDGDGHPDRLFVYYAGLLRDESWDTNGDGAFDRFQYFDERGGLTMREEDVDGDAQIDVRTAYREGRIVRREILNPELLTELQ